VKSPKVTKKIIEQEIDLMEIFGIDATDADTLKNAIGQAIIDRIQKRTESGKGLEFGSRGSASEVKLKSPYSKAYTKTREFKAAGKKANEITMELTGDMVASVDMLAPGNKIKIQITDELQVLKAYNHITGDTVPARPWFGVSKDELKSIGDQFAGEIDALKTKDIETPRTQKLLDLLNAINDSDGEDIVGD
jgi:hypothetical protein